MHEITVAGRVVYSNVMSFPKPVEVVEKAKKDKAEALDSLNFTGYQNFKDEGVDIAANMKKLRDMKP